MATGTYKYKGSFVAIRYARAHTALQVCVCCGKPFKNKEPVALLINNHRYFPNMLIHRECLDMLENSENTEKNMEELFQKLEQMSTQYKELKTYFG